MILKNNAIYPTESTINKCSGISPYINEEIQY